MVSHALGADLAPLVASGREKFGMKLVPWAAVAAELATDPSSDAKTVGRAFTFLPLPVRTGLPVHVNAYFELSSNRRDIWFGGDMAGGGAARSEWNQALLTKVCAPCYARLIATVATMLGPTPAFYALFPDVNPPEPWGGVVRELYATLATRRLRVLHTPAGADGTAPDGIGRWIALTDAVYPDHELAHDDALRDALVAEGMPLTDAPTAVLDRVEEHAVPDPERVSPERVRRMLRESGRERSDRPRDRVLVLLRYVMSDVIDDDPASAASLEGVPLFPLADGTAAVIRPGGVGAPALYVPDAEEARLMARASSRCVDRACDETIVARLETLAGTRALNVSPIDDDAIVDLMPDVLPTAWARVRGRASNEPVPWDDLNDAADGGISATGISDEYLALVWRVLASVASDTRALGKLEGFPLLPVGCSASGSKKYVVPLGAPLIDATGVSVDVAAAMRAAGVHVLDVGTLAGASAGAHPAMRDHPAMAGFLAPASAAGFADAFARAVARRAGGTHPGWSPTFTREEAANLRGFVLRRRWFGRGAGSGPDFDAADPERVASLASLRMYEAFPEPEPAGGGDGRRRRTGGTNVETKLRSSPAGPGIRARDARAPSRHGPRAPRNRLSQYVVG